MAQEKATATAQETAHETVTEREAVKPVRSEIRQSGFSGKDDGAERRRAAAEKARSEMRLHEQIMSAKTKTLYGKVIAKYGEVPPEQADFMNNGMHMLSAFSGSYATAEVDKDGKTVYKGTWLNPCSVFMKPEGFDKGFKMSCREAVQFKNFLTELFEKHPEMIEYGMELEKDIERHDLDNNKYDKM